MLNEPDTFRPLHVSIDGFGGITSASGATKDVSSLASDLMDEYALHIGHNRMLREYFDGKVKVSDYGVTADIPNDQRCYWPQKAVEALAERIVLERLNLPAEADRTALDAIIGRNDLIVNYNRHVPAKLTFGCMAATVSRVSGRGAVVRFHSAETFTALPSPDFTDGCVAAGMAIARRERTPWSNGELVPTVVNLYSPRNIGEFRQVAAGQWVYSHGAVREEIPMLFVFAHKATGTLAPFGRTRISSFVRTLTDDAIRCMWHMQVSGAFYSMPKVYMLNLTDDQFDSIMENKSKYQLSRMLALTPNDQSDANVQVGQLSGNSPQPFIDELRALACQFSGATGVPLNSLGIEQDNPSSAEAIQVAREDICLAAERDTEADKATMRRVVRAALAVEGNTTTDRLGPEGDVMPKFASPMLHSLSAKADWVTKVNSVREGFGGTDVAALMMGIDEADLPGVKSDEAVAASSSAISAIFGGSDADTA